MSPAAENRTSHVCKISGEQADHLRQLLLEQNWELDAVPYAHFRARKDKTTCTAYESGKLVIQGRGTTELVQFTLEPQVLGEVRFGYEDVLAREEHPEMFTPHAGIDESGKGDFFGPLVVAAVYVDADSARKLVDAGIQDSKKITSDKRIVALAEIIRGFGRDRYSLVSVGPEAYNRLYAKIGNVNHLLAWGHARALEDLLEKQPGCPRALSDQFARSTRTLKSALLPRGRQIKLEQRPRAEEDIAVAAASVLARLGFIDGMRKLGEGVGVKLPRGASQAVTAAGAEIIRTQGPEALARVAKMHFRTAEKAAEMAGRGLGQ